MKTQQSKNQTFYCCSISSRSKDRTKCVYHHGLPTDFRSHVSGRMDLWRQTSDLRLFGQQSAGNQHPECHMTPRFTGGCEDLVDISGHLQLQRSLFHTHLHPETFCTDMTRHDRAACFLPSSQDDVYSETLISYRKIHRVTNVVRSWRSLKEPQWAQGHVCQIPPRPLPPSITFPLLP